MARSVGISRAQVVDVAAAIADEVGFNQLTLAQVAARLEVRLPSLYNHVGGLPDLQRALAMHGVRQLAGCIQRAGFGKTGDAAVLAIAQAYRAYATAHPGVYAATVRAPDPHDDELNQASQEVLDLILAALEPYKLDQETAIHAVRGLRSLIHGFVAVEAGGGFGLRLNRDASFDWLLTTYINGLHAASELP